MSSNTNIEVMSTADVADLLLGMGMVDPPDQRMRFRTNAASPEMFWYNMPRMPMLSVTTVQELFDADEASLLRKVFTDTRALKKLGKIAAVDLYIGNTDRLTSAGDVSNPGKSKYQESLAKGMREGADGLKNFLLQSIKKKGGMGAIPPGALYRMQPLRGV